MPRRTVTVAPGLDKAVRSLQATLLQALNEDVTYTEALNWALLWGFLQGKHLGDRVPDPAALLVGLDLAKLRGEGLIDTFASGILNEIMNAAPSKGPQPQIVGRKSPAPPK